MSPSPATITGLSEKDWTRILSLIQRKWADGEIMRVTGFKLSTIAAIRAAGGGGGGMSARRGLFAAIAAASMSLAAAPAHQTMTVERDARAVAPSPDKRQAPIQTGETRVFRRHAVDDSAPRPVLLRKGLDQPRHRSPGDRAKKRWKHRRRTSGRGGRS